MSTTSRQREREPLTSEAPIRADAVDAEGCIDRLMSAGSRVVGCVPPDTEPGVDVASWINIARFVEASSDENPLYLDTRYGAASPYHTMLAPPTFVLAVRPAVSTGVLDYLPESGLRATLSSLSLTWDDAVRLGDTLDGRAEITHLTRTSVEAAVLGCETLYTRNRISLARASSTVVFRADREPNRRPIYRYEPHEIEELVSRLDGEAPPRGNRPRFFSDVTVGEVVPGVARAPLSLSDLMVWIFAHGRSVMAGNLRHGRLAGLPGRVAVNPVTNWPMWDRTETLLDSAATDPAGPSAPGELLTALVGQFVTNWMGDDAFLRRLAVRFGEPLLYGDSLSLSASVSDRYRLTDERRTEYFAVALRITGRNQLAGEVLNADAVVLLPEPGKPVELPVREALTCVELVER
ncbi:FAS1-like dehydratase domain-containing protein [Micromonospora chokoriensis]|uniref:FAS1-like dehydratase domain-containing protein n=1 Tax=Micromonospora chokoriensis TaxID=356851 RepID=UPI000A027A19|nr:MaoC family dehydratase N-terminal domain-containing protein [Micromonospora chokoriensis]